MSVIEEKGQSRDVLLEAGVFTGKIGRLTDGRSSYRACKRVFDIAFALLALIILAPLLLIVSLLVFCSGGAPIIFRQRRVGIQGKAFTIFKFRSMRKDAEKVLHSDPKLKSEYLAGYKLTRDPRITPLGQFLRKSSIDELPQLFNVLMGDMSLVGPRPIQFPELEKYGEYRNVYMSMIPGCTGLWQCSGRADTTYDERVLMDLEYSQKASFLYDLKLICKTFSTVLRRHGAY